ncbi:MAG TPA: protein kinase, partial [Labilithrix sp.]|nr:protein kinase [Labilithrix sp.]
KPGDVLGGKYKVERILGAGGMGVVVAARHVDLGQRVALKFMQQEAMTDPAHAERFLREAKAAVQLKSVHTARVLDVGRLKNGEPFLVMEYLEGRDLDAELQAHGPMPPHMAVDCILQASEALAEAHGLGMVHRDVKLKNLFLTETVHGRPLVKVLDFGLAKTLGIHGDASLTATNSVFGSPQYMSPEQMRSAKDVDFRSDIWSLGVCLYELLTGRVPFDASGVAEICAMVLKDPVPPPSRFARGLPIDLEFVILKCLEKDVELRYQSIADLAFALQNYAADEGSALRILHVMQTAQKVEHPTFITNPGVIDAGPKTLNAWDSGIAPERNATLLTRPQFIGAFAFALLLGLIGLAAITAVVKKRSMTRAEAAEITSATTYSVPPPSDGAASPVITDSSAASMGSIVVPPVQTSELDSSPTPTPTPVAAKPGRPKATSSPTTHASGAKTPPSKTTPKSRGGADAL